MIHVAVRVRELAASNLDTVVGKAGNPRKMLRLLQTEIEESLITLHGDLTRTARQAERQAKEAQATAASADGWTAKAKTAMDHKREDLARAALMAREDERVRAEKLEQDAATSREQAGEVEAAIAALEAKREEVRAKLAALPQESATPAAANDSGSDKLDRHMDRIDRLERRVGYKTEDDGVSAPAPANVDAEIAALERETAIDAELKAMKGSAKPASGRKKAI